MESHDKRIVPLTIPDLSGNEETYAVDAIRSSWISSTGEYVNRFESEFGKLTESKEVISTCNGTVALHLAMLALDLKPGDEVIIPSLTFIATANAVRYVGAEPIFVDISAETWCLNPDLIHAAITSRTRGIIAVDLYGHPADFDAINAIAMDNGLWVVEDAAEAHLALYKGRKSGSLADVSVFSFYGNKIITCGEGGALTTNNVKFASRAKLLRGQGMDPERRYYFSTIGYNYRLNNVSCAILCAQIERIDLMIQERKKAFEIYHSQLCNVKGILFQPIAMWANPAPWLFSITINEVKFGCNRDVLIAFLDEKGIETRPFFIPIHTLPPYQDSAKNRGCSLPVTELISKSGINLPTSSKMNQTEIIYICDMIKECRDSLL